MPDLPDPPGLSGPAVDISFPGVRFQAAMAALRNSKPSSGGLILVLSLAAFVLLRQDRSPTALAVLVGVLLFHELGHYTGMRLFGYSDVRMFFIPFFGAAVSGKPRGAPAWKQGVVLLLGPLPGIVAAFALARSGFLDSSVSTYASTWRDLAVALVSINVFNLLPLAGLDGARFLQHVIFSRRRWLEVAFQCFAATALIAVAIDAGSIVLGALALLMLVVLPHRWRLLGKVTGLRQTGLVLPIDARELGDEAGRPIFTAAEELVTSRNAKSVGAVMEQLVDACNARPPSVRASLALGFVWFLGLAFSVVTLVMVFASPQQSIPQPLGWPSPTHIPLGQPGLKLGDDADFSLRPPGLR